MNRKQPKILRESTSVYVSLSRSVVTHKHPFILVGWSHADTRTKHCILRASIVSEGRAMTLYQQSALSYQYHCPKTQKRFLKMLKLILPNDCRPVIVTDAGFKVPWLKAVRSHDWHYISRVRGTAHLRTEQSTEFVSCQSLFKSHARKSQFLGATELTKSAQYQTHAVLVGKGHKLLKRDNKRTYREPWLLVSSLPKRHNFTEKVIKLYSMRMQIEAGFRDQKSVRFGLGSDLHRTNKINRLDILLLLATLAHWFSIKDNRRGRFGTTKSHRNRPSTDPGLC
ncbi:IS4 family transposase [Pseudoalteromonas viridis]|uniref:IS4 family transposase n=1 Tax=Pseudoalteromonas viridis TaxID=339617 RepID=A0ABX7V846_9GAMM|nr:IS4 family transposase [Pseudoalteromonas viridis]QTL35390.1 IS4 family transposase [Pseudoalteromonas viridis]